MSSNGASNFLTPTKPVILEHPTKTLSQQLQEQDSVVSSTQPGQQHQAGSQQNIDTLLDTLPSQPHQHQQSPLHQQSPPKQFSQLQHQQRSYGQSQHRNTQRPQYNQHHNQHHQLAHGNVSQQSYRNQSQVSLPHQQSQQQQPVKRQDSHPKTWAKAVSNNASSIGLNNQNSYGSGSGLSNAGNNGGNYGTSNHYHHANNQHSQSQQYRSQFTGGNGGVGGNQRKQFPVKIHK